MRKKPLQFCERCYYGNAINEQYKFYLEMTRVSLTLCEHDNWWWSIVLLCDPFESRFINTIAPILSPTNKVHNTCISIEDVFAFLGMVLVPWVIKNISTCRNTISKRTFKKRNEEQKTLSARTSKAKKYMSPCAPEKL